MKRNNVSRFTVNKKAQIMARVFLAHARRSDVDEAQEGENFLATAVRGWCRLAGGAQSKSSSSTRTLDEVTTFWPTSTSYPPLGIARAAEKGADPLVDGKDDVAVAADGEHELLKVVPTGNAPVQRDTHR